MAKRRIRFKRIFMVGGASLLIIAGLLAGLVRLADIAAPGYREDVAAWASERLGRPIAIGSMNMLWGWHGPVLALGDVTLLDRESDAPVLGLREFEIHFSLLDLARGNRKPRGLRLSGTEVSVYRDDSGRFRLEGLAAGSGSLDLAETARWLQSLSFIRIEEAGVVWLGDGKSSDQPPVKLSGLTAELTNRGPRHRLDASATLPTDTGDKLQFEGFVYGDLATPRQARAHAYLKAERLDIAALLRLAGVNQVSPRGERSLLEAWGDWENGGFTGARVALASETADIKSDGSNGGVNPSAPDQMLPPGMGVDLSVYPDPLGYRLNVDSVTSAGGRFSEVGGAALLDIHGPRLQAELTRVPAAFAAAILRTARAGAFGGLQADGLLPRMSLLLDGSDTPVRVNSSVSFSGLSVRDEQRGFQLGSISGSLQTNNRSGKLVLDHGSGELDWPPFIRGSLPVDRLEGQLTWQRGDAGAGWQITLDEFAWNGALTELSGGGSLDWPQAQPDAWREAQVRAEFNGNSSDMTQLLRHVPTDPDLPLKGLREWLPAAVDRGGVSDALIKMNGPLGRFPFFDGGGQFTVDAKIDDLELDYKPGWPLLKKARGSLSMAQERLSFKASRGEFLGIRASQGSGQISDLRRPILTLDTEAGETSAAKLFSVLEDSPLNRDFGAVARALEVGGRASASLKLSIPLKSELGDVEVDGEAVLLGATLSQDLLPRPLDNLRGNLRFDRKGLYAKQIRGNMGEIPIVVDIAPGPGDSLNIDASALPRLPAHRAELESVVPGFVLDAARGDSVWHVGLRITDKGQLSDLILRSDLKGMAVDLPPPIRKRAEETAPVQVTVVADGSRVHVDMAGRADVDVKLQNGQLAGVGVIFGPGGEPSPISNGLRVTGRLDVLDGEAWYDFLDRISRPPSDGGNNASLALNSINLAVGSTTLWGQRVGPMQIKVLPYQTRGYEADFAGSGGRGRIQWLPAPDRTGARALLSGQISELAISNLRPEAAGQKPAESIDGGLDPAGLPITDIRVGQLSVNGRQFGSASLQGRAAPNGIALSEFKLSGGEVDATATGNWIRKNGLTSANLTSEISGSGVETLFRLLNYSPTLSAEEMLINANLNISPNAAGLAPAHLQGYLQLRMERGVLLNVEPGAGRVLGLFNFYALPKRLNFDFRDVLSQGLVFDDIRGDFTISNGVANTDGLVIDTSSAEIEIAGAINLAARTYDQRVRIEPQLSSGVAIAGTVLGGPAVGAALLVAQRLLKKPIKKLSRITYRLRGSWDDPQIETVEGE